MFFIIGLGSQTRKEYGKTPAQLCGRCHNNTKRAIAKVTSWFSLFFIPIFPYKSQYLLVCPICGNARELEEEEFADLVRNSSGDEGVSPAAGRSKGKSAQNSVDFEVDSSSNNGEIFVRILRKSSPQLDTDKYAGKNERQIAFLKKLEERDRRQAELEKADDAQAED